MPNLESVATVNSVGVNKTIDKPIESSVGMEAVEQPKLSAEDQLKNLDSKSESNLQSTAKLNESADRTKAQLNEARKKLGLPPTEEDPPSVLSTRDRLKGLQDEQEDLEKQRKELINQQEKEKLIAEEKTKILQEKLDELFKQFEALNAIDLDNILQNGRTADGQNFESRSMGSLEPQVAQSLARAFQEGIRLLPKILEAQPDLLKSFDDQLTKEATKRVDKKLEDEQKNIEEELGGAQENTEEKTKVPEGQIESDILSH